MTVINSLKQLWFYNQMERIRPSLQCSSVVRPHGVMALKLSVEMEADTTVEGCEVSTASSEELISVRRVTNQKELLCVLCSLYKLVAVWFGPSDLLLCHSAATLQITFVQHRSQDGC